MPKAFSFSGSAPKTSKLTIDSFAGVDLTNQPANVSKSRSCHAPNMIRDVPGKVRKRMGYEQTLSFANRINGIHQYEDTLLYHSGTTLYDENENVISSAFADNISSSYQLGRKLWVLDGLKYKVCQTVEGALSVSDVENDAYIPTVVIARTPTGGGTSYEPVNMLSDYRKDSFLGTAGTLIYQLTFDNLSASAVTAWKLDAAGDWNELTENTEFTVDRTTGEVTFTTAPGASPVTGEDNVRIQYARENAEYKAKVNKCTVGIVYGVGGAADRLFISGNADYPAYDFFSAFNDPTYFGDVWYSVIGQEHSAIMGYSIVNNCLATHKQKDDNDRNIYLRYGELDSNGEPVFPTKDIVQGSGCIAKYSFGYAKEPTFLTAEGICATTPYEYNSERYVQNRSFFLNAQLTAEPNLENAFACVYKEFYLLAVNGKVYILDTLMQAAAKTDRSSFQYETFVWTNIPARCIYSFDDVIYFGTSDGAVKRFFTDANALTSFADDGEAIACQWDFDFSGADFYHKKRLKMIAVRLAAAQSTSLEVWVRVAENWTRVALLSDTPLFFSFTQLQFSKMRFSGNVNPRTLVKKLKVKKIDTVRLSLRNDAIYQPFGLFEIALEFSEAGYYRGEVWQ